MVPTGGGQGEGSLAEKRSFKRSFKRVMDYPGSLPAWERSNMLVKYYISTKTKGVEVSRWRGRE